MKLEQTIFFDLDGTLLDITERYFRLFSDFCAANNFKLPLSKEEYWTKKRVRYSESRYLADCGQLLAAEKWEEFQRGAIEAPKYLQFDSPWPGVPEYLTALGERYPLMLVTFRRKRPELLAQLDALDLAKYFTEVLSPESVAPSLRKPGPDLKVRLVRDRFPDVRFGGWFVGDTETDIDCGRLLGCKTVLAAYGVHELSAGVREKADVVLESPVELVGWRG